MRVDFWKGAPKVHCDECRQECAAGEAIVIGIGPGRYALYLCRPHWAQLTGMLTGPAQVVTEDGVLDLDFTRPAPGEGG